MRVFCDDTISALQSHPDIDQGDAYGTIKFLKIFTNLWKILNVKRLHDDQRLRDPTRAVVRDSNDERLNLLLSIADMIQKMDCHNGHKRIKTFTKDTSKALIHTLRGIVDLCKFLLCASHQFVIISQFSTDPLENAFSKLRQGAGGAYFITVQQALEKLRIQHTRLILKLDVDISDLKSGHQCSVCDRVLSDEELDILNSLHDLEGNLTKSTKMALVYIAGYVEHSLKLDVDDSFVYFNSYGDYINNLSRGGLCKPTDTTCQYLFFCYILFTSLDQKKPFCRVSLMTYFNLIKHFYSFTAMSQKCDRIISNILCNNISKLLTPRSSKEPAQKVLKLGYD